MLTTLNSNISFESSNIPSVSHTYTTMTPQEWANIPDNPRQRNTERHLARASHLLNSSPTHAHVIMAFCPSTNQFWKLDGHTRSLLWNKTPDLAPSQLFVTVYNVSNIEEAAHLYTHFDNSKAVETPADKVSGAYHALGWQPTSSLLTIGYISHSLALTEGACRGQSYEIRIKQDEESSSIYTIVANWLPELKAIDTVNPSYKNFNSQILCAALLSIRRRGPDKALPFWEAYIQDQGLKLENEMDGIEALARMFQTYRTARNKPSRHNSSLAQRAISCFEAWLFKRTYSKGRNSGPKTTDLVKYMENSTTI